MLKFKTKYKVIDLIFIALCVIPITFKLKLGSIAILPQEIILPFLLLKFYGNETKFPIKQQSLPFIYLQIALAIVFVSTIFSLFFSFDILGLLRIIKYSTYIISVITIINHYKFKNSDFGFLRKIGTAIIIISLLGFFIKKYYSQLSWKAFISHATWKASYMPSGLSNTGLNLVNFQFESISLNHGIYGTYLVLLIILSVYSIITTKFKKGKLLLFLAIVNLLFLTSREAWVLLIITALSSTFLYLIIKQKLKAKYVIFFLILSLTLILALVIYQPEIVIINKMNYMIREMQSKGLDGNVRMRYNTWVLSIMTIFDNPVLLFSGIGNNKALYAELLQNTYLSKKMHGGFATVPESYFIHFFTFGGIFAFLFSGLFFIEAFRFIIKSKLIMKLNGIFLFSFLLGLLVSNLIGVSILGELLTTQFGIFYALFTYKNG
jgi:hypothetical protein